MRMIGSGLNSKLVGLGPVLGSGLVGQKFHRNANYEANVNQDSGYNTYHSATFEENPLKQEPGSKKGLYELWYNSGENKDGWREIWHNKRSRKFLEQQLQDSGRGNANGALASVTMDT
ncbi:hypothetical protein KM043_007010 [Ampulex compressa]|nr:hypothetical protein KM043_007010 [Ampulex compressa]